MANKKTILTLGVTSLLLVLSFSTVSANNTSEKRELCIEESNAIDILFDEIELAASSAQNYFEFLNLLRNLLKNRGLESFPILNYIMDKIVSWITSQKNIPKDRLNIKNVFDKLNLRFPKDSSKEYFVFSCGSYNRWNPRKENEISLLKPGFKFWRYSGESRLFKGRTLIIERHPFGIKQRVMGSQIGLMMGFRGFYSDWESRLTGNAYNFFIGRVNRIIAFDTSPFSD
jgi:hypothetical protein